MRPREDIEAGDAPWPEHAGPSRRKRRAMWGKGGGPVEEVRGGDARD